MSKEDYKLVSEVIGYNSADEATNTDPRYLVGGSQNVLIDRTRKVAVRKGYTRLGAGSTTANPIKNQFTWLTSTGASRMLRNYDDELEVWVGTLDTVDVNAWHRVVNALTTTEFVRFSPPVWKDSETLDVVLFVQGNANLYEWCGGVAVAASVTSNTITKKGTSTFAQNRFYVTANRTLVNTRTGTEFAYTGGTGTTTLTGVTPDPSSDIVDGDILVQKVVTNSNEPAASRNNDTLGVINNHVAIGSNDDNEVYLTSNTSVTDTTFSAPRVAGEGALFTLDGPSRGFGVLGKELILFAGTSGIFRSRFEEITVSTTLAEVLNVKKVATGVNQGSFSADTIVQLGNAIMYLSNEPAARYIQDPNELEGLDPKTLSNPIKPDFDDEDFTNAHAIWFKNAFYLSSPVNSKLYILEFIESADGILRRFWQPPQLLPVRSFAILDSILYTGSSGVQETLQLFVDDTYYDLVANGTAGNPDDKLPISAIAKFAYNTYGRRGNLKNFDEYFAEGEINPATIDLLLSLNYDFGGATQIIEKTIDGSDTDILEETISNASLGQIPLGQAPTGGALNAPENAAKFTVIFEIAREDFKKIQSVFSTNAVDRFWSILSHGPNTRLSNKQDTIIKK